MRYKFYELDRITSGIALVNVRAVLARCGVTADIGSLTRSNVEALCVLLGIRFDADGDILMDDGEGGDN